jgi:subtilisin family serine protease
LSTAPAQAEFSTDPLPADDQRPCEARTDAKDGISRTTWTNNFIGLDEAHQYNRGRFEEDGTPVTIAVIDSGVQADHDAFAEGQVEDGFDFWDPGSKGQCDAYYHGTGVAAIAAGQADGDQFVGVAPEAKILPLRAFEGDEGADDAKAAMVAQMILEAVNNGADVINISIALPDTAALKSAVETAIAADVVIVAASGNDNLNMDDDALPAEDAKFFPADYPEVIAVGAHNQDGNFYLKTNFGENLDLLAPGQQVTFPYAGGGYLTDDGTSYAAPFVAGAAALLKAQFGKDASPAWIEKRLESTAIHPPDGFNVYQGHGVLNISLALTAPLVEGEAPSDDEVAPIDTSLEEPVVPEERDSIAAIDIDYDPLAFEKLVAWASIGISIVLITLVLVLKKIIPKGRKRGWRPGTRRPDNVPLKVATDARAES